MGRTPRLVLMRLVQRVDDLLEARLVRQIELGRTKRLAFEAGRR